MTSIVDLQVRAKGANLRVREEGQHSYRSRVEARDGSTMCSGKTSPPLYYCSPGARGVLYPQRRDNSSNTVVLRPSIDAVGGDVHEKHLKPSSTRWVTRNVFSNLEHLVITVIEVALLTCTISMFLLSGDLLHVEGVCTSWTFSAR